ncbi:MAG: translation initiation factor IF-2 [Myxococcota bacterium]
MSKVRVYEVARELGIKNKELVALFQSLGFNEVRNHMSAVEPDVVEKVKRKLSRRDEEGEVVEKRVMKGVIKRRSRGSRRGAVERPSDAGAPPVPARARTDGEEGAKTTTAGAESSRAGRASKPRSSGRGAKEAEVAAKSRPGNGAVASGRAGETPPAGDLAPAATKSKPKKAASKKVATAEKGNAAAASATTSGPAAADAVSSPEGASDTLPSATKPSASDASAAGSAAAGSDAAAPLATGPSAATPSATVPPVEGAKTPQPAAGEAPSTRATDEHADGAPKKKAKPPGAKADGPAVTAENGAAVAKGPKKREEEEVPAASRDDRRVDQARDAGPRVPSRVPPKKETQPPQQARRSNPPKTGIEVWGGRPGVPMPARPAQRRKTFDPRANQGGRGFGGRPGNRGRHGFRGRPGGYGNRHQRRGPVEVSTKEMSDRKKVVKVEGEVTLQNFANQMSMKATDVLMKLLGMGVAGVHINSTLDVDTATIVAEELGWRVEDVAIDIEEELEAAAVGEEEELGEPIIRAPIVTVMGHVDHGKTTLLDKIRKADVASGEAGGITQHIGAYRVETSKGTVCFLDTPGHAAFTSMRQRGASVTDIVILVVAADDGVMPQTREAIKHAQDADVPIIVAVNKIDKPGVEPDKIMREMSAEGLTPEEWGGDTIFSKVSALKGTGVDELLEMILLQAEVQELRAWPEKRASGVVVEALLDKGRGPVARVLVQDGTMRRGDVVLCGTSLGKIRAMMDEKGRQVKEAGPATPVEVLGLNGVPSAGDPVNAMDDLKLAETLAEERQKRYKKSLGRQDVGIGSIQALQSMLAQEDQLELKVILKADVQGSVEALQQALEQQTNKKVKLTVVHTGVGGITETDVQLAVASRALILGFNVRPAGKSRKLAEQEDVDIRMYSVIYEAIDDVRSAMEDLLPATKVERSLGTAEIRAIFRVSKVGVIAGCMVTGGIIRRNAEVRVRRGDDVVHEGKIDSLKRFKDDAREVREGFECGIGLDGYNDVEEGDVIECFEMEEVKAKLDD